MSAQVSEGDKVSWKWNGSNPSGTVGEVKAGEVTVTSHRGNEIKKTGDESDPAVHIERSGNDVVKLASELNVEKKAQAPKEEANGKSSDVKEKDEDEKENEKDEEEEEEEKEVNGDVHAGDKRKADEASVAKKDETAVKPDAKKQKTTTTTTTAAENGEKKKAGRPKGSGNGDKSAGAKKEKKVPAVGQAARKTRSQGKADE